ncbi:MAG: RNA-binding S4 domain-containing protein [Bacillota bacterium]|nr:RNA-binding S4 domain-containing protein [Bacillota bacterium]
MGDIPIHTPYIALDQFLKWADLAGTGGEAKALIAGGQVLVNGEVERRRGRKLYPGDVVEAVGRRFTVTAGEE